MPGLRERTAPLAAWAVRLPWRAGLGTVLAALDRSVGEQVAVVLAGSGWRYAPLIALASPEDPGAAGSGSVGDPFTQLSTTPAGFRHAFAPQAFERGGAFLGGGWFGCLGYECLEFVEPLGLYPGVTPVRTLVWCDAVVRRDAEGWLLEGLCTPANAERLSRLASTLASLSPGGRLAGFTTGQARTMVRRADHVARVEAVRDDIAAGEVYQVNLCARHEARFTGSVLGAFARAVAMLRPRFGAFVRGEPAVVSLSPELLVRIDGDDVTVAPIKGTQPRTSGERIGAARAVLLASVKDVAENVMIVDLMRNDLGRVCATGSVSPRRLLHVEAHPGVWHLVSYLGGRLARGCGPADALRAMFPSGSVTGAPKIRAMQLAAAYEGIPRRAFTGAVGYLAPHTALAEWNVAIRTFEVTNGHIELGVGGAVTIGSDPVAEWEETLHKARPLWAALRGIDEFELVDA